MNTKAIAHRRVAKALLLILVVTGASTIFSGCAGTADRHDNRMDRRDNRQDYRDVRRDVRRDDRYDRRSDRWN